MKKLIYVAGISFLIFLTSSCKNSPTSVISKETDKSVPVKSNSFLESHLNPISYLNTLKGSFIDSDPIKNIYGGDLILEKSEYKSFVEKVNDKLALPKVDGDIVSLVLYMNDFNSDVLSSNIRAVSLFLNYDGKLIHKFLINNNGKYNELSQFGGSINRYSTFDLDVLLNYSLKINKNFNSPAYVSFSSNEGIKQSFQENGGVNLSNILINSMVEIDIDPESGCGSKCFKEDGGCAIDSEGEKSCDHCASSEAEEVATKNKINFDTYSTFSKPLAYDFRDNYLKKSTFGRKYVNYYYKLSYVMKAKSLMNKDNFWKNVSLGLKLYTIAKRLQYGNADEIIISKSEADEIIIMLEYYKSQTKNPSIIKMLLDINNDLNNFIGKSRADALELIK